MPDGALLLLLFAGTSIADPGSTLPNGHAWGCQPGNISAHHPFCDTKLSYEKRIENLVSLLSLEEKIGLMSADSHTHVSSCNMMSSGCLRLGIPSYMHLVGRPSTAPVMAAVVSAAAAVTEAIRFRAC